MFNIKEFGREIRTRKPGILIYILFISMALLLAIFSFRNVNSGHHTILIQILGLFLALFWSIIHLHRQVPAKKVHQNVRMVDWIWLGLIAALLLRFYANTIFPPRYQTGFEEIQTGSNAFGILLNSDLPIEFRFTNIIGSLGFLLGENLTLPALRFLFQISGLLSLIILFLSLKSIRTPKLAIITTVLLAAVNKFLVLGSGIADELFAGSIFLFAFMFCVIRVLGKNENGVFWTAMAGIFAGILFYEYICYRIPILFLSFWFLISLLKVKDSWKLKIWPIFFSFIFCCFVVAVATIMQTIKMPADSVFFEGVRRHMGERNSLFVSDFQIQLLNNIKAVFGFKSPISALYTLTGKPLYNPVYGVLFILSLLYNLFNKNTKLTKGFSLCVLFSIISLSVFTNNNNIGRIFPILPFLFLLTGDMLGGFGTFIQNLYQRLQPKAAIVYAIVKDGLRQVVTDKPTQSVKDLSERMDNAPVILLNSRTINLQSIYMSFARTILNLFLFSFLILMVTYELSSLQKMARDVQVLKEYVNNEYAVCSFIGSVYENNPHVFYFSETGRNICASTLPEAWYFNGKLFNMESLAISALDSQVFSPGDLIVLGEMNIPVSKEGLTRLMELGVKSNSAYTYRTKENLSGYLVAASVCYACDN